MAVELEPNTLEWLKALKAFNPQQAAHTESILRMSGDTAVCSVCGDAPAKDYKLSGSSFPTNAVITIRLCDDCLKLRKAAGESFQAM